MKSNWYSFDEDEGDMPPLLDVDEMLENDEIDSTEAGFIAGYRLAEEECFD